MVYTGGAGQNGLNGRDATSGGSGTSGTAGGNGGRGMMTGYNLEFCFSSFNISMLLE